MPESNHIPIPSHAVLWNILAQEGPWHVHVREGREDGHLPTVELEWGWDAGLTPEELAQRGADTPRGRGAVRTTLEDARRLHARLGDLLEQLDLKVAENPPPPPTPGVLDLIFLYVMAECERTGERGPFDPRALMQRAPAGTLDTFERVLLAAKELPAEPGESLRAWHARLLAKIAR